ncbi:polysaccharide deacetylase family protein [Propionivibrio sp.]|uniref:polysaccharide deacetylase family protein n=1 Tax=Propionivibrio sp. TaxID=2212460 RepID=UPI0039E48C43
MRRDDPDTLQFDWMLRLISRNFTVLPLGKAVERLKSGTLPAAAACITFDDGYKDNLTVALPLLRRYGLFATFFVAAGFLDGGRMWNDDIIEAIRLSPAGLLDWSEFELGRHDLASDDHRRATIAAVLGKLKYAPHDQRARAAREIARRAGVEDASDLMMTADEVRSLRAAGMEIGGHTWSHPILNSVGDDEAYSEIVRGKTELEAILRENINLFAYPNGNPERDFSPKHVAMIREAGFAAAVTTERGVGKSDSDPLLIPRFTPWDRTPLRFAARCALAVAGRI